jgi:hypothetical protein
MTKKRSKPQQLSQVLQLERLYADIMPLPGDDLVFALTDAEGRRLLREDGNFEDIEVMPSFCAACQQVGMEAEAVAITSAYLNSPRQTYWLMVSAAYHGQTVQDIIPVGIA